MRIVGVDHTSFAVSDLQRSLDFYVGLLGCQVIWQREIADQYFRDIVGFPDAVVKAAHLRLPGSTHTLELLEYVHPRSAASAVHANDPGSSHLALLVEDLTTSYAELQARGVRFRSAPVYIDHGANAGGFALYMLDPDGINVELFQPAKGG